MSESIWYCWYKWHPSDYPRRQAEYLKSPQGAFDFFIPCLLDEGVKADLLVSKIMPNLKSKDIWITQTCWLN